MVPVHPIDTPELIVTREFEDALQRLHHGENVFLTGKAGTGKSTLIREFMAHTRRNVVVVAPTGIAALNVQGYTIHRLLSLYPGMTPEQVRTGKYFPGRFAQTLRELHTLIVDEASMVRADLFDCLVAALERFGPKPGRKYGGVQLVLVGDLYQLPPVVTDYEREHFSTRYKTPYFFSADTYHPEDFATVELSTVFRQIGDNRLVDILNAVREGSLLEEARRELNARTDPDFTPPIEEFWLTLTTTNRMATSRNRRMLEQIEEEPIHHAAILTGDLDGFEIPVDKELVFKRGAQVMMLTNDPGDRWVNGTIAKVADYFWDDGDLVVFVELPNGDFVKVEPNLWEVTRPVVEHGTLRHEVIGTYTQLPFRLAWAITIHKSQGQTLDNVVVDLTGGTFADGQLYVALSRCTSFEGLVLRRNVLPRDLKVDQRIRRFLRSGSHAVQPSKGNVYLGICSVGDEGDRWRPRPAELALVTDDGLELSTLVNPTRDMGDARVAYDIAAGQVQLAPLLTDAWAALAPHLAGRIPVGINIDRQLGYLDYELKRTGYVTRMPMGYDVAATRLSAQQRRALDAPTALERARAVRDLVAGQDVSEAMADPFPEAQDHSGYLMPRPGEGAEFTVRCSADAAGNPHGVLAEKLREAVKRGGLSADSLGVIRVVEEQTGEHILGEAADSAQDIDSVLVPGARICFTGTVIGADGREVPREGLEDMAVERGLRPVVNVTKTRCDVLVTAEDGSQSNKAKNAAKWGKPVFTAREFMGWWRGEGLSIEAGQTAQVKVVIRSDEGVTPGLSQGTK
ncbi:AAA family ATPase [Kocuria gwangalliensis]|uniref:AAA family ATPase n=1 Tax=Kocuria gwangalliensis TaxID=501592 RepID=A0ABP8WU61_9MICC